MRSVTCWQTPKLSFYLIDVPELVGVYVEVVVGDDAWDELAVQVVVGGVDGADTRVSVSVGVGAGAERPVPPQGLRLPVVVVVGETVHEGVVYWNKKLSVLKKDLLSGSN